MKKDNLDIAAVRALHQARQFDQAEAGYLVLLRKNPKNTEVLHALSILCVQRKNFSDAIDYLKQAIKYEPNNSILQLHLANVLKAQGLFNQAETVLQKTIAENPHYASAFNNLGTVFYAQGKFSKAISAYRSAIEKEPEFMDAYYNLGLVLVKQNQWDEAILAYQQLLRHAPNHFAARFHLACVLMQQNKIDDALTEFITIEKAEPNHYETQFNMATCYLKKGAFNEAKIHYMNALSLTENDGQILFNLGVIETQLGNMDSAIQYYQKAIRVHPDFFAAHNNLGVAFLAKQHAAFALQHFQEAARLEPNNVSIQYTIQALSHNQQLASAPTDYVKSLFNSYADHYEKHLLTALDYQIPTHFQRVLMQLHRENGLLDCLDLGCGTGLCGEFIKPFAKTVTGVDLSENMLEMAREKNIYDILHCGDFNSFLTNKTAAYDLIVAGDALVYLGNIETLFQMIQQALRNNGYFIFNTEISESEDYKMNQSGRFSHHKKYIETLSKKNNLSVKYYEKVITRMQNNEPVYGHLYVLQRNSSP